MTDSDDLTPAQRMALKTQNVKLKHQREKELGQLRQLMEVHARRGDDCCISTVSKKKYQQNQPEYDDYCWRQAVRFYPVDQPGEYGNRMMVRWVDPVGEMYSAPGCEVPLGHLLTGMMRKSRREKKEALQRAEEEEWPVIERKIAARAAEGKGSLLITDFPSDALRQILEQKGFRLSDNDDMYDNWTSMHVFWDV